MSIPCYSLDFEKETDSIVKKRFTKAISIDIMQYYITWGVGLRGSYSLRNDLYLNVGVLSGNARALTPYVIANNVSLGMSKKINKFILGLDLGCSFSFSKGRTYGYPNADVAFEDMGQLPIDDFKKGVPYPWYTKKFIDFGLNTSVGYEFKKIKIFITGTIINDPFYHTLVYRPNSRVLKLTPGFNLKFNI